MKIKLFITLLLSVIFILQCSQDEPGSSLSLSERMADYEMSREDFNFLNNSVVQLQRLNLPSRLEGKLIFLGITRVSETDMLIQAGITQDVENDVIVVDEIYRDNDDAGKILRNIEKYFLDQPEPELIEILTQDLAVGESNCKYWQIN